LLNIFNQNLKKYQLITSEICWCLPREQPKMCYKDYLVNGVNICLIAEKNINSTTETVPCSTMQCRVSTLYTYSQMLTITTTNKKEQVQKVLWKWKGVCVTVVTAGHCRPMHAELTSGHALAICYSCCTHSRSLC